MKKNQTQIAILGTDQLKRIQAICHNAQQKGIRLFSNETPRHIVKTQALRHYTESNRGSIIIH